MAREMSALTRWGLGARRGRAAWAAVSAAACHWRRAVLGQQGALLEEGCWPWLLVVPGSTR